MCLWLRGYGRDAARRYALLMAETGGTESAERIRALTEMAQMMVASGADADQVATELLRRTDSPTSTIKAMINANGMGLGDAKRVVHRNLDPEVREAAESL
jgi:ribosomal protein L7/L12